MIFKRLLMTFFGALMLILPTTLAQPAPGPGGNPSGGPNGDQRRDDRGGPGGGGGFDRPPGGGPGGADERGPSGGPGGGLSIPGGPGGGMNRRPGGGPGMPPPPPPVEAMRNYLELVRSYAQSTRDPTTAAIAAVIAASDILKSKGPQAGIDYFNKVLPDVKNDAVQRAIRGQLAELYKQSGQADKALEQLQTLMTSAPAGDAKDASQNAPPPPPAGR